MTTDLQALLDQIDRLDKDVTPGPWAVDKDNPRGIHDPLVVYPEDDGGVLAYVQPDQDDAEFIALARTALPKLAEAVYQVLSLLDAEEKRTKYQQVMFDGTPFPPAVSTNEVRQAITDAMEDQ